MDDHILILSWMDLLALIDCLSYLLSITFNNTLITNHGRTTTVSFYLSIYNSYKAKSHYNIFLQFHEATSSQGSTKSLSSVYTSTKYHQEMKRPQNNWCKTIEEPRGHVIVMVFIHHVQHVTPHNRLKFHHTASSVARESIPPSTKSYSQNCS